VSRRNADESRDNRVLGLLAHCVRNLETHEAQAGCNVVVNLLSQRAPDEIVDVLRDAWAELGRFDKARERFGQVWEAVAKRVPGLARRSLYEAISGPVRSTPRPRMPSYAERAPRVRPPWQTDERSSNDEIRDGSDFRDVLYCMRAIYDRSVEMGGERRRVTFWAHDGSYNRGVFTAFCSDVALGFGGEVMDKWNSDDYATKAVFATFEDDPRVLVVRMLGEDVSQDEAWFEHESFNMNPFNDRAFEREMRTLIADAEITRWTRRNTDAERHARAMETSNPNYPDGIDDLVYRSYSEHGYLVVDAVHNESVVGRVVALDPESEGHLTAVDGRRLGALTGLQVNGHRRIGIATEIIERMAALLAENHGLYLASDVTPKLMTPESIAFFEKQVKEGRAKKIRVYDTKPIDPKYTVMRYVLNDAPPATLRNPWTRRNSDADFRAAERLASTGDPQAQASLRTARLRAGLPVEPFVPPAHLESVLDRHGGFTVVTSGSRIGTNSTLWRPSRVLKRGVEGELTRHEGGRFYQNIKPVVWGYYKVRGYRYPVITFWHELTGERIA